MKTRLLTFITLTALMATIGSTQAAEEHSHQKPAKPDFSTLDLNVNGEIDFDEFSSHEIPMGDHQTVFEHIDADSNGVISEEEFANHKPPRRNEHKG